MGGNGYLVDGELVLQDPDQTYTMRGTCEQVGDTADVEFSLNGGAPYVGQIYEADDGQVYFEGQQNGSNITFVLQRQSSFID